MKLSPTKARFSIFIVLLLLSIPVIAQKKLVSKPLAKCSSSEAPKLRGFHLGQTVDEIQNTIPGFREAFEFQKKERSTGFPLSDWRREIEPLISSEIDLVYVDSNSAFGFESNRNLLTAAEYEDVHVIWWFVKEKLFAYGVYYSELDIDQDAQNFIKQVSAKTVLPQKGWKVISGGMEAELLCNGFKVFLNAGYRNSPHLIITDTTTEAEIVRLETSIKLRKKKEEQERIRIEKEKRGTFKP